MLDQAAELRQLARRAAAGISAPGPASRLIVCSGGKGGVGTTTAALGVAAGLARLGHAAVLVDAHLRSPDLGNRCRLVARYSLLDVLAGGCSVHEALVLGPRGVQVLPGGWGERQVPRCSPQAQERLLAALRALGAHAEFVVLDAGSGLDRVARRFWHAADRVLLVTTPEASSVMSAYAAIKVLADGDPQLPVDVLVNRAEQRSAEEVFRRLEQACRRFLARGVGQAGWWSDRCEEVSAHGEPGDLAEKLAARLAGAMELPLRCRGE